MKKKPAAVERRLTYVALSFYEAIAQIRTKKEAQLFFKDLCTPAEEQALIDRWYAANLLKRGMTHRQIASKACISVTTIGRVARCMNNPDGGYQHAFMQLKKK